MTPVAAKVSKWLGVHGELGGVFLTVATDRVAGEENHVRWGLRARSARTAEKSLDAALSEQAACHVRSGAPVEAWFEAADMWRRHVVPVLVQSYGHEAERLAGALAGMQRFVDHAAVLVVRESLNAKERQLDEQRRRHTEQAVLRFSAPF